MVGGGGKRKLLLPWRTTKSVKGKTFYESRDTVTEEKCLSNELGNQKAGGRGEETTKCRNQKATQRAYCSLVLRGLKPRMNMGRFFKDSKVLCSFLIALSDLC